MGLTRETLTDDSGSGLDGEELDNDWLQRVYDTIELNWTATSYTPTWTASTTNPTIGNGTITGQYFRIGKKVHFSVKITAGSTTTFGSGNYSISLPLTASTTYRGSMTVDATDSSAGGTTYGGRAIVATTTTALIITMDAASAANFTPTNPITFATGDTIEISGWYWAA